jgi:hypothetical protein
MCYIKGVEKYLAFPNKSKRLNDKAFGRYFIDIIAEIQIVSTPLYCGSG